MAKAVRVAADEIKKPVGAHPKSEEGFRCRATLHFEGS